MPPAPPPPTSEPPELDQQASRELWQLSCDHTQTLETGIGNYCFDGYVRNQLLTYDICNVK